MESAGRGKACIVHRRGVMGVLRSRVSKDKLERVGRGLEGRKSMPSWNAAGIRLYVLEMENVNIHTYTRYMTCNVGKDAIEHVAMRQASDIPT